MVLGGWDYRCSFPDREAPWLSAARCERGAFILEGRSAVTARLRTHMRDVKGRPLNRDDKAILFGLRRAIGKRLFDALCEKFPDKYIALIQPRDVAGGQQLRAASDLECQFSQFRVSDTSTRVRNYLLRALACERMAGVVTDDAIQSIYLDLAAQWRDMAKQLEMFDPPTLPSLGKT